ncbi:Protein PROTON GRADIENT REGULATION 5, chloroplastic [Coccomyxa sp. Obi]|nr:Protein PROTON GRADIENT REGULATION 5, chloroplastic [Coccomyxa sp. Obi]
MISSPSVASWDSFAQPSGLFELRRQCSSTAGGSVRTRQVTRMGNKSGTGPFTPLVIVVRNVMGKKEFNQLRGKAISLHSQVIKSFGAQIGAENKQVQGLIRLAKKNGEKLGFLS